MSTALAIRTPPLEWSWRAASGELDRLKWVDLRLDPDLADYRTVRLSGPPGGATPVAAMGFRHRSPLQFVPGVVREATLALQKARRPTAWEGLALIFARVEWLVRVRGQLWAPTSPVPRLLSTLVETFGVEPDIHQYQPDRLARLAALLPVWHPHRGTVLRAREVLAACDRADDLACVTDLSTNPEEDGPRLDDEILVCHAESWWALRREPGAQPDHRISGGFVRFQAKSGARFGMMREDALMLWQPGSGLPHQSVRLLPAWTVVRLAVAGS